MTDLELSDDAPAADGSTAGGIARVIVDSSADREFDYVIPDRLRASVAPGSSVVVPFGQTTRVGYVVGLADKSSHGTLKPIHSVRGDKPLLTDNVLVLVRWIADYYCTPVEDVIRAVLPAIVRRNAKKFKEQLSVSAAATAADALADETLARRSPKQALALKLVVEGGDVFLQDLLRMAATTASTIRALEKKSLVTIAAVARERDPHADYEVVPSQPLELMPEQAAALERVRASIVTGTPSVVLLYGVTGSGKTEVYLQAIDIVRERGQGAIVLVPEISLTPQTVDRFRARFGDGVAVLHSELSDGERHDEWHKIREGQARIVVGARSALFAPVVDLGLIVVDEEHESTYKQADAPRYHARDMAVMRGRIEGCAVVLGTATPSLESMVNAQRGKYERVDLPHRVDHRTMPDVRILDMRVEAEREGRPNVFSRELVEAIRGRLARAEQTMLFLNRRGFSTSVICTKCGYVAMCNNCSLAVTYHRHGERLCCHVCGDAYPVPANCPECADPGFKFSGLGTQRIENIVGQLFPGARVERMDADTTSRKHSMRRILGDFRTGKTDILIGTQMIAKGLHFPNVTLIGVVYADLSLYMPDFRAGERTVQLLTQVAGRAGRGDVAGEVIVQTYTPHHPAIQAARRIDYDGFCDQEIEFRRELSYPPFTHMICVTLRGRNEEAVSFSARTFARALRPHLGDEVIAAEPCPAPIAKAKGYYRYQVLMRSPAVRKLSRAVHGVVAGLTWPKGVACSVDIDPQSLS